MKQQLKKWPIGMLICLMLSGFSSFGQNAIFSCNALSFGDFVSGNAKDSVYVYRDFSCWYELNKVTGVSNIFTIVWNDNVNFQLVPKKSSETEASRKKYNKKDTLTYKVVSCSDTSITFNVSAQAGTYRQTLSLQREFDTWGFIHKKETEEDSLAMPEIFGMTSDSVKKELFLTMQQFKKGLLNPEEIGQVQYVLSQLASGDVEGIYSIASDDCKQLVSPAAFKAYHDYLTNTYGKLRSYSIFSSPLKMDLGNLFGGIPVNSSSTYIFNATFEKAEGNVRITVKLRKEGVYKVEALNVQAEKDTKVPFIENLTKDFWTKLKAENYKEIYDGSSKLLREKEEYEQVKGILALIRGYGMIDSYRMTDQNFITGEESGLVFIQYRVIKNDKKKLVGLYYNLENGTYKLAGVKFN